MKVVLAGGSGFIGRHLQEELTKRGYQVVILSRNVETKWDAKSIGPWVKELEGAEAVINLAGKSISVRMTEINKQEILESRRAATQVIGEAIQQCEVPPKVWLNANAMGYYGDRGDEILTE
ncbi:MAG: NAD-dependent epimerase/dehydratase family protein, partial [Fimbriimonas sp.]